MFQHSCDRLVVRNNRGQIIEEVVILEFKSLIAEDSVVCFDRIVIIVDSQSLL